jgi:hypothetical protein
MRAKVSATRLIVAFLAFQTVTAPAAAAPTISVGIRSASDTVKVGSDLRIKITITNISNSEIQVGTAIGKAQGEFLNLVDVRDDQGDAAAKTKYYREIRGEDPVIGGIRVSASSSRLKPNESVEEEVLVNKLYNLEKPGNYSIQIQRDDPVSKKLVKSNTVMVTVAQ